MDESLQVDDRYEVELDLRDPLARPGHAWSGWPGAYCLKCGAEHAMENAIALNWYDPLEDKWDTEEHRLEVEKADGTCPADQAQPPEAPSA